MNPYYQDKWVTIYQGDCLDIMPLLPKCNLILTSPPYEDIVGAGYTANRKDILFFKLYSEFMDSVFDGFVELLKEGGQLFFNVKSKTHNGKIRTPHWIEFTEGFNKLDFKSYVIWKYAGSFDSTIKRLHLDYEIIYHLSKGENIYLNTDGNDALTSVWYIPHIIKERLHPTQMPEKVAERIIKLTTKPEESIIDTFGGVGTTAVVAKRLNRRCTIIEIVEKYCEIAARRCSQEVMELHAWEEK